MADVLYGVRHMPSCPTCKGTCDLSDADFERLMKAAGVALRLLERAGFVLQRVATKEKPQ